MALAEVGYPDPDLVWAEGSCVFTELHKIPVAVVWKAGRVIGYPSLCLACFANPPRGIDWWKESNCQATSLEDLDCGVERFPGLEFPRENPYRKTPTDV